MPFPKPQPRAAAKLSGFAVTLHVQTRHDAEAGAEVVVLRYRADVLDAGGEVITRLSGDLREHLTATQAERLDMIARALYEKAKTEILT